jgi:hypothetical protein
MDLGTPVKPEDLCPRTILRVCLRDFRCSILVKAGDDFVFRIPSGQFQRGGKANSNLLLSLFSFQRMDGQMSVKAFRRLRLFTLLSLPADLW